jgi:cellulose synthase/poly-beta-1,6-N-acetylglucosamine synthase-like glycosyltransferase
MVALVFIIFVVLAAIPFAVYPLVMLVLARARRQTIHASGSGQTTEPSVTVIVAAYNEQDSITKTVESLLAQEYPRDKFKIIVFSDGSSDRTEEIVRSFSGQGVGLVRFEGRIGKTECQNRMVERLSSDVIIFSDGNVHWQPRAVKNLVAPFSDARVGATTGALHLVRAARVEQVQEGLFRKVDDIIKKGESALSASIGVNGPIYAVRRSDYIRLAPHLVSDLVLPFLLVARGRRVLYVPSAVTLEPTTPSIWHEFRRKRRLVTQGFVALPLLCRAAFFGRRPALLLTLLISHKMLRWIGIELLLAAFIVSLLGLPAGGYIVVVVVELALIIAALVGIWSAVRKRPIPILDPLGYFLMTNIASLLGWLDAVRGKTATTWVPQPR